MQIANKNNKLYGYIIILISLFIVVLFTRNQISSMQVKLDEKEQKEIELQTKRDELQKLNDIKSKISYAVILPYNCRLVKRKWECKCTLIPSKVEGTLLF